MAELVRTYVVPLRREWRRAPRHKRTPRAVRAVSNFVQRHMKAPEGEVKITPELNKLLWENGIKNPPHKIYIDVKKDDKDVITVQIHGRPFPVKEEKKKEEGGLAAKVMEKLGKKPSLPKKAKKEEPEVKKEGPKAEKLDEKKPEAKPEPKEEAKPEPKESRPEHRKEEPKKEAPTQEPKKETPKPQQPKPAPTPAPEPKKEEPEPAKKESPALRLNR